MALNEQLKSEMTDIPVEMNDEKFSVDDSLFSEKEIVSISLEILKSIDSHLKMLDNDVASMKKICSENHNVDFEPVFTKIESVFSSIEKLFNNDTKMCVETNNDSQKILTMLQSVMDKLDRNDRKLMQTLKDNATFQIQVRQGMQKDLDMMREQISGEQFDPLLREIATLYVEYKCLLCNENMTGLLSKNLQSLFEQIEDMLNDYGAEVYVSVVGALRHPKASKIIEKIPTGNKEQHNTVALSRKPGVIRGNTILYPEFIDVFVYDPSLLVSEKTDDEKDEDTNSGAESKTEDQPLSSDTNGSSPKIIYN